MNTKPESEDFDWVHDSITLDQFVKEAEGKQFNTVNGGDHILNIWEEPNCLKVAIQGSGEILSLLSIKRH